MKPKHFLALAAASMLTACASGTVPTPPLVTNARPTLTLPDYARPAGDVPAITSGSLSDLLANHVAVAQHDAQCQADKARLWEFLHGLQGFDVAP